MLCAALVVDVNVPSTLPASFALAADSFELTV